MPLQHCERAGHPRHQIRLLPRARLEATKDTYSTAARQHLHALQSLFRHALHHLLSGALLFSLLLRFPCTCLQIQCVVDQHFSELCCVVSCRVLHRKVLWRLLSFFPPAFHFPLPAPSSLSLSLI